MDLEQQILDYAKQTEPHECCGFVIFDGQKKKFLPCKNIAGDPRYYFEISSDDYLRAVSFGEVLALVHSHPTSLVESGLPYLSTADRVCQVRTDLPFWLVCQGKIHRFRAIPPLLGRHFIHRQQDCLKLFLDCYMLAGVEFDLSDLEDYAFEWFEQGKNLYEDNLLKQGFEKLAQDDEPQLGDAVLIQVGSPVGNHIGVYLGNQMLLHHSVGRLSARVPYDGFWLAHTHSIWRYKQWQQLSFTAILNDLQMSH